MDHRERESSPTPFNPADIALRVAMATGNRGVRPDIELGPDTAQEVFLGLAGDRSVGGAVINLSRFSKITRIHNGQKVPDWSGCAYAHIGYYDPAQCKWLLYPEYVKQEEQQPISDALEELASIGNEMLKAEAENGKPFVDMLDPFTVQARQEMADLLQSTGLGERLIINNPIDYWGNPRSTDEFTSCHLALTPRLSGPGIGSESYVDESERQNPAQYGITFDQFLTVSYRGLVLDIGNGNTDRAKQLVHIAARSMDDENIWVPDLAVISMEDWEALADAPRRLLGYKQQNPNFSAEHCAVVYHYDH